MSDTNLEVAVIMGSDSDLPVVEAAFPIFDKFGINYTKNVMSAHRTPHDVIEFIKNSENNGCKVFIAAAGMAAHLAGALAAHTVRPVIGIPIESGGMGGLWKNVAGRYEIDGKKVYAKAILKDPDQYFTPEVMQQLDAAAKQIFSYGTN